ncbi:hypothetical protein B0H17DRAFT_1142659 [Mycena rosella]|uniref:Uncharacterized protein n=1 Tax=Mycena rosella TaxID=1033263 RepID=A0AAD7CX77_MYCRO|nr:hypothetical protein B0H17DRAFT_1142659 [Mycena rosella]
MPEGTAGGRMTQNQQATRDPWGLEGVTSPERKQRRQPLAHTLASAVGDSPNTTMGRPVLGLEEVAQEMTGNGGGNDTLRLIYARCAATAGVHYSNPGSAGQQSWHVVALAHSVPRDVRATQPQPQQNRVHGISTMEAGGSGGSATGHRLPNDSLLDGGDNVQGRSETSRTGAAPQQGRVQVRLVNDERPNALPADAYGMQEGALERAHAQNAQRLEQPETENECVKARNGPG